MTYPDHDFYDDDDDCPDCGGDGGYASCMEDCCPVVGGEECCDDPVCWRVCSTCRGGGFAGGVGTTQAQDRTDTSQSQEVDDGKRSDLSNPDRLSGSLTGGTGG